MLFAVNNNSGSNVFTPGERRLPTLLRELWSLESQLVKLWQIAREWQPYGSGKSKEVESCGDKV